MKFYAYEVQGINSEIRIELIQVIREWCCQKSSRQTAPNHRSYLYLKQKHLTPLMISKVENKKVYMHIQMIQAKGQINSEK